MRHARCSSSPLRSCLYLALASIPALAGSCAGPGNSPSQTATAVAPASKPATEPLAGTREAAKPKTEGAREVATPSEPAPKQIETVSAARPSWVDDPASFYDPPQEGVILVVGKANIRGSEASASQMAQAMARIELMKVQGQAYLRSREQSDSNSTTQEVQTSGTVNVRGTLAEWASPEGVYYVLMR